jgi:ribulose kinase
VPTATAAPAVVVCVDFGSTFTKAVAVDVADGQVLATASSATSGQ